MYPRYPTSYTQAYRQFGNSVAVPVIREIARVMIPQVLAQMQADRRSPPFPLPMETVTA